MAAAGKSNPRITETVYKQYITLLRSGSVNMLDTNLVRIEATHRGYKELAELIDNNVRDYVELLSRKVFYKGKYGGKKK